MSTMKSYEFAIHWLAMNDGNVVDAKSAQVLRHYLPVVLVADIYGKSPLAVAKAVLALRKKAEV